MILMMCFELTRLFCLNEWIKEWNRSNNPGLGAAKTIYTFEPKVIALFGIQRGESEED